MARISLKHLAPISGHTQALDWGSGHLASVLTPSVGAKQPRMSLTLKDLSLVTCRAGATMASRP